MQGVKGQVAGLFGSLPRVAAMSAVVAVMGLATSAQAVVVHSGAVSIGVPDNIDGIYVNVVTGAASTDALGAAGWDINPYSALAGNFNLWGPTTTTWLSPSGLIAGPYPLAIGTSVGPGGVFTRPGGGTNVGAQVALNAPNYFGFQFLNEGTGVTNYGWVEVTFGASAGSRSITAWAYENSGVGLTVTPVPEPATMAMWLAGLAGVASIARRRRSA